MNSSASRFINSFKNIREIGHVEKQALIKKVKSTYPIDSNEDVMNILEIGDVAFSTMNGRKVRFIGLNEIANAEEFLHTPFPSLQLLPLFDLMGNDFICYDLKDNVYVVFNIIDESKFLENPSLDSLMLKVN